MALQGTLDTFALADLVRLLATTEKTGELAIDGDRGEGRLWFADGDIVAGEPAPDGDVAEALFALLRMEQGDFRFDADVLPEDTGEARRALDVLQAAEERLEAWRPVEALVPTPLVTLALRPEIDDDEVRLDRATWRVLVAAATSATAADLARALDLDEVATAFAIRDLVDAGLVEVGDPVDGDAVTDSDVDAETDVVLAPAPTTVDEVFVPVEIEDVPLPGEEEVLAARAARAAEAGDEAGDEEDLDAEPVEDAVAPWGGHDELPTLSSAAELLSSSHADDLVGLDAGPLGPWEPLLGPDAAVADELPADELPADELPGAPATLAEALPPIDDVLPSLEGPGADDVLPTLEGPSLTDSLAVDLDARLGSVAVDHSYLGATADAGALPEPLPAVPADGVEPLPEEPAAEAPTDGATAADTGGEAEPEADAHEHEDAPVDADRAPWPDGRAVEELPVEALSPAAAAAVAAAAAESGTDGVEAGRRVLRRIISTGKG